MSSHKDKKPAGLRQMPRVGSFFSKPSKGKPPSGAVSTSKGVRL